MELKDINDATAFIKKAAARKPWFNTTRFLLSCPLGRKLSTKLFLYHCERYFADNTSSHRFLITIESKKISLSQREFILLYLSSYQELKAHQVSAILKQSEGEIIDQLVNAKAKIACF